MNVDCYNCYNCIILVFIYSNIRKWENFLLGKFDVYLWYVEIIKKIDFFIWWNGMNDKKKKSIVDF